MSVRDKHAGLRKNITQPVTEGMAKWRASGSSQYTQEAYDRVIQVMHDDMFTGREGDGRLRPSLIGSCPRQQLFSWMGVEQEPPSSISMQAMDAGTDWHYRWQLIGLSQGFLTDIEVKVVYEPWNMRGSVDGILSDGSGFELKTVNSWKYKQVIANGALKTEFRHMLQVHAYMIALDIDMFSIVYQDRNSGQYQEIRVAKDPVWVDMLTNEMESLVSHIGKNTLPSMLDPCKEQVVTDYAYQYCPYKSVCPTISNLTDYSK